MSYSLIEQLESRTLMHFTLVRMETTFGNIDLRLTDDITPITVNNFLNYVNSKRYNKTIWHRNSGAVIQGGGYAYPGFIDVRKDAPIVNEFQSGITTNIRGTIGMAKTSDPNSATSEFFINLSDNSSSFDNPANSGGFTTFGTVTSDTLATVDAISAVPVNYSFNSPFNQIPLQNYTSGIPIGNNLVFVNKAYVLGQYAPDVQFGIGARRTVSFIDADGTLTNLTLNNASGTIDFGQEVFVTTKNGKSVVTGSNLSIQDITITNAANGNLLVNAIGGNGSVDLGNVTATGTMGGITALKATLDGTLTVNGDIARITLGSINSGDIVISGAGLLTRINVFGAISDSDITAAGTLAQLSAGSWTDSNGSSSQLTAAAVQNLIVRGEMAADMTLSGSGVLIRNANLANISGGNWFVNDSAGLIRAGVTSSSWNATFGGSVVNLNSTLLSGNVTARSIRTIRAVSMVGANFNLNKAFDGAAAVMNVTAASITNSTIRSTDLIKTIAANSIDGSFFSAGINFGDNSIDDVTDFVSNATIGAVNCRSFNNSGVIAQTLGRLALGVTNDAVPTLEFYGVAGDTIASLTATVIDKKLNLKLLNDPAAVPGLIAAQGVTPSNFQIRVV